MEKMNFRCIQCGKCCKNLIFTDHGIQRGLTLFPEETKHFPEKMIKPYIGIGKRPYESGFKVHAYQLVTMNCIHLSHNKCSIYTSRPTSCRQYPFSLEQDPLEGILLGIDMNCPAAIHLVNNSDGIVELPDRNSAEKLLNLKKLFIDHPKKAWLYNYKLGKWIRYDKIY
jgi:Fe-S-cluster containining protein